MGNWIFTGNLGVPLSSGAPAGRVKGQVWWDSADNKFKGTDPSGADVQIQGGSVATTSIVVWQRIAVHDTAGAAEASFTWSGLAGDTDLVYTIYGMWVAPNPAGDDVLAVQPNADGTAGNYNNEHISGANTTVTAGKNAGNQPGMFMSEVLDNNDVSAFTATLYAKSGLNRTLVSVGGDAMGATYLTGVFNATWLDTATQITSLKVVSMFGGSDIGIGSHFELWAQRTVKVVT